MESQAERTQIREMGRNPQLSFLSIKQRLLVGQYNLAMYPWTQPHLSILQGQMGL